MCGEVHAANAAASTRHWNVAPASEENVNVGVWSLVGVGMGVSAVSGAAVSTVQVRVSGVASCVAGGVDRAHEHGRSCAP